MQTGLVLLFKQLVLHFLWRPQLRDVADEMVLETAINGRVDKLVTFNQRHLNAAAQRINCPVCDPPNVCLNWRNCYDQA